MKKDDISRESIKQNPINACANAWGRLWIMRIDNRDFTDAVADAVQDRSD